ncbi:hypothetical protein X943_000321 [Babesia divergens]|uniref:TNFR-Cys domain-containing protein n=1 Tax=Babesia divergens TaxID=32595 RepID=A0AAD9LDH8_BABDI|nr:hypothetical protein X943_000321 [Babesia divergens]
METKGYTGGRLLQLSGITPGFAGVTFFLVGMSVSGVFTLGNLVSKVLADGLGVDLELSNHCYQTRQLIIFFAIIGAAISMILGLCGRISCIVNQWLLAICYFAAAAYVNAHYIELHLRIARLMQFTAIAALLSSMAYTSAVYCMTDASMPGGNSYMNVRLLSFLIGCAMSGLNYSYFFAAKQILRYNIQLEMLTLSSPPAFIVGILCCIAGMISLVAAALSSYMLMMNEVKTSVDKAHWFPFLTASRSTLSASSLRRQMSTLYMPLLWTSNPLFVVFALSVTLNSTATFKLLCWQYTLYLLCAVLPLLIFSGDRNYGLSFDEGSDLGGGNRKLPHASKGEVCKTRDMNSPCYDEGFPNIYEDAVKMIEGRGALNTRPTSHIPTKFLQAVNPSGNPQWSLLRGDLWSQWQRRDAMFRLCSNSLSEIYSTLQDLRCLQADDFNGACQDIMEQYREHIMRSCKFINIPFSVDKSTHPMTLLRDMIKHQRNVILIQMQRAGNQYAGMLKDQVKGVSCGVVERFKTLSLCCTSVLYPVLKCYGEDASSDLACTCCFVASQSTVERFLQGSIEAISSRCESLGVSLSQHHGFTKPIPNPELHDLDTEKKLICYLLVHCESAILLVNLLLLLEELLILQEWLCLLCKYTAQIHEKVQKCKDCECEKEKGSCLTSKDVRFAKCAWCCLCLLLHGICKLLKGLHKHKMELLNWIRSFSTHLPDEITTKLMDRDMSDLMGSMNAIRALIIIVLAAKDLVRLEECEKNKSTEEKVCKCGNITTCKTCKSKYHLLLPSAQYLCTVVDSLVSSESSAIGTLLEDLVSWYAGLMNTITNVCTDDTKFDPCYSYDSLKKLDKEVKIDANDNTMIERNLALGATVAVQSKLPVMVALTCLEWRNIESKSYTLDCKPQTTPSSCPITDQSTCTSETHKCESEQPCVKKVENTSICDTIEKIKEMFSCSDQEKDCKKCFESIKTNFDTCKQSLEELCKSEASPACSKDCCAEAQNVARYAKLIKHLTEIVSSRTSCKCMCIKDSKCCCSKEGKQCFGDEPLTTLNILICIFCCKCCPVDAHNLEVCCCLLKIFYCTFMSISCKEVLQKLQATKSVTSCCDEQCTKNDLNTCIKVTSLKLSSGRRNICKCLGCWCDWFRCYVMCGFECCKDENTCKDCSKCVKQCCVDCKCEGDCEKCDFSRLSRSLFFCSKCCDCEKEEKETTCETVECSAGCCSEDCVCSKIELKGGSGKQVGSNCCSHRLGCTLEIVTKDIQALKHNTCQLAGHIDKVKQNVCQISSEVKHLNDCFTKFHNVLCYTQYGIEYMCQRLQHFRTVSDRVECEFPCFEDQIKKIAAKDATMIPKLKSLLFYCLRVAYDSLLVAQRIIWICSTVVMQRCRLTQLNTDLCHLKTDMNTNWDLLSRLKGGYTLWHANMCTTAELGKLKDGRPTGFGFRPSRRGNAAACTFKPVINAGMGNSFLNCLKYFWVLLCLVIFMRYFSWFGFQDFKVGSNVLATLFTGLSAFHLTMAIRGAQFQSVTSKRGGGKTGTYINTVMLLGLLAFLFISWCSNIMSTYSGMRNSLNHVTKRLRIVGIYDSYAPKEEYLLLQTVAETFTADINGLRDLLTLHPPVQKDITPGLGRRKFVMMNTKRQADPNITNLEENTELTATSFLSKMKDSSFVTPKWVLDAIGFVYMHPDYVQMLNRATPNAKNRGVDLPLLWSAWSTRTQINDSLILECRLCKEALLNLNEEYLTCVQKVENLLKRIKLVLTWNLFYGIQYAGLAERCTRFQKRAPIYTEAQKAFVRDTYSRWYVSQWEKYHKGLGEFSKEFDDTSQDVQQMDLGNSGATDTSESLRYLSRAYLSQNCMKMHRYNFIADSASSLGENNDSNVAKVWSLDGDCVYEKITDASILSVHAQSWEQEKVEFCSGMGEFKAVCVKIVEAVMSKLQEFLESETAGNQVEQLYKYAIEGKADSIVEESKTMYMKQPYVSHFLEEDSDLAEEKVSLFSSMQPDDGPDSENAISEKYRDDVKRLLEVEESDSSWWRILYWLGTWSIFHPVPISQRDMRYLLI